MSNVTATPEAVEEKAFELPTSSKDRKQFRRQMRNLGVHFTPTDAGEDFEPYTQVRHPDQADKGYLFTTMADADAPHGYAFFLQEDMSIEQIVWDPAFAAEVEEAAKAEKVAPADELVADDAEEDFEELIEDEDGDDDEEWED